MAVERILLVQLADIGDLVLATPAMASLREALPKAKIDLLASDHALDIVPPLLVNSIISLDKGPHNMSRALFTPANLRKLWALRRNKYDAIVFLHHFTLPAGVLKFRLIALAAGARQIIGLKNHNINFLTDYVVDEGFGKKHQAQYWLDLVALLGASSQARPAQVKMSDASMLDAELEDESRTPMIVIHAGSGGYSKARRWSPEGFAEVAEHLRDRFGAKIVLVGQTGDDSAEVARLLGFPPLNLVGKTTLPQLADVIRRADIFIGADSGVMHIAAATGAPVLSIFGPSNYRAWRPWTMNEPAALIRSGVECSPCSYVGHAIGARDGCPARTCMKLVTSMQVIEAARNLLERQPMVQTPEERPGCAEANDTRLEVLGVPVDAIVYGHWMKLISQWIGAEDGPYHVCTVNPEFIMIAQTDPIFLQILRRADLCVPDGVGLLWASRYLGKPIPERVTGSDGVPLIARRAAENGWSIFFLGAGEGIAEIAATILRKHHPELQVAGTHGGSPAENEEDEIIAMINRSKADILFVAYGAPQQDKWIARNLPRLEVKMAMGIGGSLDFIVGAVPRAPRWMRHHGLEWLYRLMRQPWRFRRMLRLPRFVIAVMRQR